MTDIEKRIKNEFGIQIGDTVRFKKYDWDDGSLCEPISLDPWVIFSIKMVENNPDRVCF